MGVESKRPNAKQVVLTGASGPIADAVKEHLKSSGADVDAFERGDDISEAVKGADAIVVLDAAALGDGSADYRSAIHAVVRGLGEPRRQQVITVTMLAGLKENRQVFLSHLAESERELRDTGVPLTILRCGVVYGSDESEGPADEAILAKRRRLWVPGPGTQRVDAVTVTELAQTVVDAVQSAAPPARPRVELITAGAVPLDDLVGHLNGEGVRIAHVSQRTVSYVAIASTLFPASLLFFLWLPVLRSRQLPREELILSETETEVEVPDLPVTGSLRDRRRARDRSRRQARRYAVLQGTPLFGGLLLLIGLCALVLGGQQTVVGPTLASKLSGGFLALGGTMAAIGGAALFFPRFGPRYAVGFVAGVTAAAILLGVAIATWWSPDGPVLTVVICGNLLLFVIIGTLRLQKRGSLGLASFFRTSAGTRLTSLVFGGTILGFGQFVYTNAYVPATGQTGLEIKASAAPSLGQPRQVTVSVDMQNFTERQAFVLGAQVRVGGLQAAAARSPRNAGSVVDRLENGGGTRLSYRRRITATEVLDSIDILPAGFIFFPEEAVQRQFVIDVPKTFEVLTVDTTVLLAPRDGSPEFLRSLPGQVSRDPLIIASDAEVVDRTWLGSLIAKPRYVHVFQPVGDARLPPCLGGFMDLYIDNQRQPSFDAPGCADNRTQFAGYYDVIYATSSVEVPVTQAVPSDRRADLRAPGDSRPQTTAPLRRRP